MCSSKARWASREVLFVSNRVDRAPPLKMRKSAFSLEESWCFSTGVDFSRFHSQSEGEDEGSSTVCSLFLRSFWGGLKCCSGGDVPK